MLSFYNYGAPNPLSTKFIFVLKEKTSEIGNEILGLFCRATGVKCRA